MLIIDRTAKEYHLAIRGRSSWFRFVVPFGFGPSPLGCAYCPVFVGCVPSPPGCGLLVGVPRLCFTAPLPPHLSVSVRSSGFGPRRATFGLCPICSGFALSAGVPRHGVPRRPPPGGVPRCCVPRVPTQLAPVCPVFVGRYLPLVFALGLCPVGTLLAERSVPRVFHASLGHPTNGIPDPTNGSCADPHSRDIMGCGLGQQPPTGKPPDAGQRPERTDR